MHWAVTWHKLHELFMVLVWSIYGNVSDEWCIQVYTDIDLKYHPHISTLFNLTCFHMLGEEIHTGGPIHIYYSDCLTLMAKLNSSSPLSNPSQFYIPANQAWDDLYWSPFIVIGGFTILTIHFNNNRFNLQHR